MHIVPTRCQLQALLRLELCKLFSPEEVDGLDAEQMAEEVDGIHHINVEL